MNNFFSTSEEHGLSALRPTDLSVYSVGISTAGVAELRMAELEPDRHIIATTIDTQGLTSVKQRLGSNSLSGQLTLKLEDVSQPLPYTSNSFDFIYARLVLHYLSKQQLVPTLAELYRVLKSGGRLFIVVRSNQCLDAIKEGSVYNPENGMTTYWTRGERGPAIQRSRYFHSEQSIKTFVEEAGFKVENLESYVEKLFHDFDRTVPATHSDDLIELLAAK